MHKEKHTNLTNEKEKIKQQNEFCLENKKK